MSFFYTNDIAWLKKWDDFLLKNDRGSHLQLTSWLDSYNHFGFDYEVALLTENEKIIGGYGAVIAKALLFKFYCIPFGPIVKINHEDKLEFLIDELKKRAKKLQCCYAQISLPILPKKSEISYHGYDFINRKIINESSAGSKFKYIYPSYGINWVSFIGLKTKEELLNSFSVQVRRNINLSLKNSIELEKAITEDKVKIAYSLIEKNAKDNNYAVRSWESYKKTLLYLTANNTAIILLAKHDSKYKGSLIMIESGNYYTYIFGGTTKEKPDLKMGYLLHWQAMVLSLEKGFKGYNISMGGSKGVEEFKAKFNTQTFIYENGIRHWILQPTTFKIYQIIANFSKKHKGIISKLMVFFNSNKKK